MNTLFTYRFEGRHVLSFASDAEAFEDAVGWFDSRSAHVEKEIDGVWHYFDSRAHDAGLAEGWVNPDKPLVKFVSFQAPGSEQANRTGHGPEGGYCVMVTCNGLPAVAIQCHRLNSTAHLEASRLDSPWAPFYTRFSPHVMHTDWLREQTEEIKAVRLSEKKK